MKIKMELLSDTIFGNGMSIPGAEDISVLCDEQGFPYYKGGTFKGVFREELERYFELAGEPNAEARTAALLGKAGSDPSLEKLVFSDFVIAERTKRKILKEVQSPDVVTGITTNLRTFTAIEENGMVKDGSLRIARCVDKGISFYSEILCSDKDRPLVEEVLGMVKWIGSMRNRGFGKVKISVVEEVTR